ncbi:MULTISPECIES: DUF3942 family protein [Bacillus]|uniref:DUF3942 family protein n=1 Tax=Bacillus TaxID=1386 RepID=UPI000CF89D7B|nr:MULTISPECIES: DUF3942 family protein [Bacillus]MDK3014510.1 DUF3942 family protein [Bacillus sp. RB3]PQQ43922.1 DUF3942 domain-containing protein [Bacillus thuringiensis]
MSFQNKFAERAKQYLGEDLDEKIIKDQHNKMISDYLVPIRKGIGTVQNQNYKFHIGMHSSQIVIDNVEFRTEVNTENNTISIEKIVDGEFSSLDTIVVQDEELFAVGRNEKFTTELLASYLRETFGEKLGL